MMGEERKKSGEKRESEKRRWGGNRRLEPERFKQEESVPWLAIVGRKSTNSRRKDREPVQYHY